MLSTLVLALLWPTPQADAWTYSAVARPEFPLKNPKILVVVGQQALGQRVLESLKPKTGAQVMCIPNGDLSGSTLLVPVPASVLEADLPGEGKGLFGRYFPNPVLMRGPILMRTDKGLNFDWRNKAPGKDVPKDDFSVSWAGSVTPPIDGEYIFGLSHDGGARLMLDGSPLIDDWVDGDRRLKAEKIKLKKGRSYPLVVHYYHRRGAALCSLLWLPPGPKKAIKPTAVIAVFDETLTTTQFKMLDQVAKQCKTVLCVLVGTATSSAGQIQKRSFATLANPKGTASLEVAVVKRVLGK